MARRPRIVLPGIAHHITQRGNRRQDVFLRREDRSRYIQILHEHSRRHDLRILAWCLMTNHVHLIAIPGHPHSLANTLREAQSRYSSEINRALDSGGHLWQGRFFSCPLDERHLWAALHYVEQNPVRAGIVTNAWDWPWSSARSHTDPALAQSQQHDLLLSWDWLAWMEQARLGSWHHADWKASLSDELSPQQLCQIRKATQLGEPLGSENFVASLEQAAGRRLRVYPQGRPKKKRRKRCQTTLRWWLTTKTSNWVLPCFCQD